VLAIDVQGDGPPLVLVLAARRPDLVRRLVLAAPAGLAPRRGPIPAVAGRAGVVLIAGRRLAGPLAGNAIARRLLLLGMVADPAGVAPEEARRMLGGSKGSRRIGAAIAAVAAADLRPHLPELTMPVAFLWGADDRVFPVSSVRALRTLVPGARTEIIPRAGHVPQLERPAEFVAAVERLLVTDP
jgi:pimeloyl-ACP methyl ester carboxylesterase